MRFIRFAAALMAVVVISGCYHTTVNTGKAPGSQTISDDWHTNWFFGIIPGADIDASSCKGGVAKVETQQSFLNGLVGAFVGIVWAPNSVMVTCASGSASLTPADRVVGHAGGTRAQAQAALEAAVAISASTGSAVFVRY